MTILAVSRDTWLILVYSCITKTCPCNIHRFFIVVKNETYCLLFLPIFTQRIDCGYMLEPPHQGGSNEYPQFMLWSKNKKNRYPPFIPQFCYIKVGLDGVHISRTCFPDV